MLQDIVRFSGGLWLCMAGLAGCTTYSITKVDPVTGPGQAAGFTYSLPKPCLQVTPNSDGTVSVAVTYLPDIDHTYAIQTHCFLSMSTASFARQNELLSQVNFNSDNTAALTGAAQIGTGFATGVLQSGSTAGSSSGGGGSGAGAAGASGAGASASAGGASTYGGSAATPAAVTPATQPLTATKMTFIPGTRYGPVLLVLDETAATAASAPTLNLTPLDGIAPDGQVPNVAGQARWPTHISYPLQPPVLFPTGKVAFSPKDPTVPAKNLTLSLTSSGPLITAIITSVTCDNGAAPSPLVLSVTDATHLSLTFPAAPPANTGYTIKLQASYLDAVGNGNKTPEFTLTTKF